jgi:tRNA uridine 5-carboxymethylaminomethyl modification enzyme
MFICKKKYDVIVVGAGHAGVEAALAAARMGCEVLLLTINADAIGQMSCNPAIGGLAKGHIVREIDALGGEMGINTDMTGIQFRMLNKKKGPAVWAPRAQCDKKAYQLRLKWVCERQPRLEVKQDQAIKILQENQIAYGVETSYGIQYNANTIIVTTGTFLKGLLHVGSNQSQGGRAGDIAAMSLSKSLQEIGLELGRLKTGTPPRLLKKSINFFKTEVQNGDNPPPFFSYWNKNLFHMEQVKMKFSCFDQEKLKQPLMRKLAQQLPCYITYTTDKTANLINSNLHKSPLYSGAITGIGPRYCPSIEDKIVRFSSKERHQIFLEPEGIETDEIYVNGLSTSLPYEVQIDLVQSLIGCENAEILRPAYAVEYDFVFPTQISASLETKICRNLFLAGQINGTSGYEEAAAQGLIAGINAARRVNNLDPIVLRRNQAYIGVLIDDLVTKGTSEPYRMFTSRAEFRLLLRQDNADMRLSQLGFEIGLLPLRNYNSFSIKERIIKEELTRLHLTFSNGNSLAKLLSRPNISYKELSGVNPTLNEENIEQIEIAIKYEGYINRQDTEVTRLKSLEDKKIPDGFDFYAINNLRLEARQKLSKISPKTIGQAARISGVSPSDISVLLVYLKSNSARIQSSQ